MASSKQSLLEELNDRDVADDLLIASIKRRKLMRQLERVEIENKTFYGAFDPHTTEVFVNLNFFRAEREAQGPDALKCPACGDFPDDPRLSRCAHVYCEECYSEMLYEARINPEQKEGYLVCEAPDCTENIFHAFVLDQDQWQALCAAQNLTEEIVRRDYERDLRADFGEDWEYSPATSTTISLGNPAGDHGESSGAIDITGETEGEDDSDYASSMSDEDYPNELSDDGYGDTDNRSTGYESDPESDLEAHNEWLAETSPSELSDDQETESSIVSWDGNHSASDDDATMQGTSPSIPPTASVSNEDDVTLRKVVISLIDVDSEMDIER